jgi:hypothetical protein
LLLSVTGGLLGTAAAYVGATRIFTCVEPASYAAVCAGGYPFISVAWGVAIGSVTGLIGGFALSRRRRPD